MTKTVTLATFRAMNDLHAASDAIQFAQKRGLRIDCHATDAEPAREGLTVEEATEVAEQDVSLLKVTYTVPVFGSRWESPQNIGGDDWAAYIHGSSVGVLWSEFGGATVVEDNSGHVGSLREFDDVDDAIAHAEGLDR